jgi:hypothetical protein
MYKSLLLFILLAASNASLAVDYADKASWLCRPDHMNACDTNLDTTIIAADGSLKLEPYEPHEDPPVDCFYVYPTVSNDLTGNSDMSAGPEETGVIHAQFARFGSVCRTFAPLYRQVTLTALRARFSGKPMKSDRALGVNDVVDAWDYYMQHDNQGRGVVLIGHSQGSGVLSQLIATQIDGKPIQSQILSAMLIGTSGVAVPEGRDVGGTFKHMRVCRSETDTQCIITFASFRTEIPPPENSLFGRPRGGTGISACSNPANLAGGIGELHAYFSTTGATIASSQTSLEWVAPSVKIDTPFVSLPGLLNGQCVRDRGFSYFSVNINSDPDDPRTDKFAGDVIINGEINRGWGLHLIDMHLGMGNMIDLVRTQSAAYQKQHSSR